MNEPCFVTVKGDQFIYVLGRIAWYITIEGGVYWVTEPGTYAECPSGAELEWMHDAAQQRLKMWLVGRQRRNEAEIAAELAQIIRPRPVHERPIPPIPAVPKPDPVEHLNYLAESRAREERRRAREVEALNREHQRELRKLAKRIEAKTWRFWSSHDYRGEREEFANWARPRVSDHEYIEAMFRLYSQARWRLL